MLKILFLVECDDCGKSLPYVHFSTLAEGKEWEDLDDWAKQISRHAQRFLHWRVVEDLLGDEIHSCPDCSEIAGLLECEQDEPLSD
jgi:hypothetical protein